MHAGNYCAKLRTCALYQINTTTQSVNGLTMVCMEKTFLHAWENLPNEQIEDNTNRMCQLLKFSLYRSSPKSSLQLMSPGATASYSCSWWANYPINSSSSYSGPPKEISLAPFQVQSVIFVPPPPSFRRSYVLIIKKIMELVGLHCTSYRMLRSSMQGHHAVTAEAPTHACR